VSENVLVGIIMGSQSDWETMKHAADTLDTLKIAHGAQIISAHRTPDRLVDFAKSARDKGFQVIIAGAGGAAHLPGMTAAMTSLTSRPSILSAFMRAYLAYVFLVDFMLAYAIYTALFQLEGLSVAEIGILLAFWSATAIVLELPSGALSDHFDRRVLLIALAAQRAAHLVHKRLQRRLDVRHAVHQAALDEPVRDPQVALAHHLVSGRK